jgi:hypothetical protein
MATLLLSGSVGSGSSKKSIPHNDAKDVEAVRDRLVELGYTWVSGITKGDDKEFIRTLKLFQSICKGKGQAKEGDGRVDREGNTHRWLAATNAPRWVKIFGETGVGWHNTADFDITNGGYCTDWLHGRIASAGLTYRLGTIFAFKMDFPPLWIRECSPEKGGNAKGHTSHETGLDVDMRLPLLAPDTQKWTFLGAKGYEDKRYYRDAAEAQLRAVKAEMDAPVRLFNDPKMIAKGLCSRWDNHQHHYHIRIKPPTRIDGVYK